MPTYEYECKKCGHSFEAFQSMSDDPLTECPECGKELRRLINGGSGVIFKGSGFYVTDKGKGAAKSSSKSAGSEGSGKKEDGKSSGSSSEKPAACASCPAAASSGGTCPATTGPEKAAL
jgi:putative FmdB family regulatory protein